MKELKFRAKIPERNATIHFALDDLVHPRFSIRELLFPWLLAGNIPQLYSEMKDKNNKEIFSGDKIKIGRWRFEVSYSDSMWYLEPLDGTDSDFLTNYRPEDIEIIEGDSHSAKNVRYEMELNYPEHEHPHGIDDVSPKKSRIWLCEECLHIFTESEAREMNDEKWGHPCKAHPCRKGQRCESHIEPYIPDIPERTAELR